MVLRNDVKTDKMDVLESTIGNFGKWQLRVVICMALLKFPVAWFQLGIVFLAPRTEFWCRQPQDYKSLSAEDWMDLVRPHGNESNYEHTNSRCTMRNIELPSDKTVVPCKWGYEYNRSVIHNSIVTEWNLVCDKERYVDYTQMTLMLGVLLGNFIFSILADTHGRKKTLMACIFLQSICGIISAWAPWFEFFLVFRFFMAVANGGTMIISFVMCVEVVGGKWRSVVAILYQIPFGIGNTVMALMAYYYRDWRELQLALSLFSAIFILYIWTVPESPRWLLATGKRKKAAKVLEKASHYNRLDVNRVRSEFLKLYPQKPTEKPRLWSILATSQLRKRTLILSFTWLLNGVTFFGFSQYLGQIGSNIYFTVSVGGLIVIPGTLLCVYVVENLGRRWTIAGSLLYTSACFVGILFVALDWAKVLISALGIIGFSVSSPALYLFSGELYPTVLRNIGVGWTIMFCRIGSVLSPLVISSQDIHYYLPLCIFAMLSLLQAFLVLILPESSEVLPETINDIEMCDIEDNNNATSGKYLQVAKKDPEETNS